MSLSIVSKDETILADLKPFIHYIEEELNVAEIKLEGNV